MADNFENFLEAKSQPLPMFNRRRSSILKTVETNLNDLRATKRISFGNILSKKPDGTITVAPLSSTSSDHSSLSSDVFSETNVPPGSSPSRRKTASNFNGTMAHASGFDITMDGVTTYIDQSLSPSESSAQLPADPNRTMLAPCIPDESMQTESDSAIIDKQSGSTDGSKCTQGNSVIYDVSMEIETEAESSAPHTSEQQATHRISIANIPSRKPDDTFTVAPVTSASPDHRTSLSDDVFNKTSLPSEDSPLKRKSASNFNATTVVVSGLDMTMDGVTTPIDQPLNPQNSDAKLPVDPSKTIVASFITDGSMQGDADSAIIDKQLSSSNVTKCTQVNSLTYDCSMEIDHKPDSSADSTCDVLMQADKTMATTEKQLNSTNLRLSTRAVLAASFSRVSFPRHIELAIERRRQQAQQARTELVSFSDSSYSEADSIAASTSASSSEAETRPSLSVNFEESREETASTLQQQAESEANPLHEADELKEEPVSATQEQEDPKPALSEEVEDVHEEVVPVLEEADPEPSLSEKVEDVHEELAPTSQEQTDSMPAVSQTTEQGTSSNVASSTRSSGGTDSSSGASKTLLNIAEWQAAESESSENVRDLSMATTMADATIAQFEGTTDSQEQLNERSMEVTLTDASMMEFFSDDSNIHGSFISRNDSLNARSDSIMNLYDDSSLFDETLTPQSACSSFVEFVKSEYKVLRHQGIKSCDENCTIITFLGDLIQVKVSLGEITRQWNGINIRKIESIAVDTVSAESIDENRRMLFLLDDDLTDFTRQVLSVAQRMFLIQYEAQKSSWKDIGTSYHVPKILQLFSQIEEEPLKFIQELVSINFGYKCQLKLLDGGKYKLNILMPALNRNVVLTLHFDISTYPNEKITPQLAIWPEERHLYSVSGFVKILESHHLPGPRYIFRLTEGADNYFRANYEIVKRMKKQRTK